MNKLTSFEVEPKGNYNANTNTGYEFLTQECDEIDTNEFDESVDASLPIYRKKTNESILISDKGHTHDASNASDNESLDNDEGEIVCWIKDAKPAARNGRRSLATSNQVFFNKEYYKRYSTHKNLTPTSKNRKRMNEKSREPRENSPDCQNESCYYSRSIPSEVIMADLYPQPGSE